MKKFIFSAVAMIAFVGSSMANDIAEKEEIIVEKSCIDEAVFKVNEYEKMHGCLTATQYHHQLKAFFNQCQRSVSIN